MTRKPLWPLALAASLLAPWPALALPQPPTAAAPAAATPGVAAPVPETGHKPKDRLDGNVTAIDAAKRTLTVTRRRESIGTVVAVANDARISRIVNAGVADLKLGDTVMVQVKGDVAAGATSIDAHQIRQVPARTARPGRRKPGPQAGYRPHGVEGVIAATSPALTLTTPGGVTVTVKTSDDTKVSKVSEAAFSDIAVGDHVAARVTGPETAPVASEVQILPAPLPHERGQAKKL